MTKRQKTDTIGGVKTSKWPCGFCSTDTHEHCPSVVVNGDGVTLLTCPCGCPQSQITKCVVCGNKTADEVNPDKFTCLDATECMAVVNRKRENARLMLFPNGQVVPVKPKGRECNCSCGNFTAGGLFKPGHADKLVADVAKEVKAEAMTEDDAREMLLSISEGLLKKLDARL